MLQHFDADGDGEISDLERKAAEEAGKQMAQNLRTLTLEVRFDGGLRDGRMMRLLRVGSYPTFDAAKADLERVRKYAADAFITPAR